ncbi:MAG: SDR family NAD(P)-dependent oxidoreductase, partial [Bacteroidota bacterium]
ATSVYPELNKEVGEEEATRVANPALWDGEQLLQNTLKDKVCTLRLGGLMGDDRVAGKYFAGKKDLKTGDTPVNYIHRDDAIGIITKVIEQEIKNEVFNVVAPQHPTRKEVYLYQAQKYGFEVPTFAATTTTDYKQVSTEKLRNLLNYSFQYPDPLNFK